MENLASILMAFASLSRRRGVWSRIARARIFAVCCFALSSIAVGQVITEFAIPTANVYGGGITAGPDGNLWFTEVIFSGGQFTHPVALAIGRISTTGVISEFSPPAPGPNAQISTSGIASGADGNLWFTDGWMEISRITTSGVITRFPTNVGGSSIVAGPDGDMWWGTVFPDGHVARTTTGGAQAPSFSLPSESGIGGLVGGPDGNTWFTEPGGNNIGRITTAGTVTEIPVPTPNSQPTGIAVGPDGNLWFTEALGSKIGRITTAGVITEYSIPTAQGMPKGIAAGPDGNMWFTELAFKIGRITTGGVITEFPVSTGSQPSWITVGPDGNMWFSAVGQIGKVSLNALCTADTHTLCLNNGRFSVMADFQQTPEGPSIPATAVPLTDGTGYFWFFDSTNIELVTKVLTGCSVNNSYWVFAGGLTDVGVEMKVTDTVTGAVKTYSNMFGTPFQPIQDSSAFPCP